MSLSDYAKRRSREEFSAILKRKMDERGHEPWTVTEILGLKSDCAVQRWLDAKASPGSRHGQKLIEYLYHWSKS